MNFWLWPEIIGVISALGTLAVAALVIWRRLRR